MDTMSDLDPTAMDTASASDIPRPTNNLVTPMLTDLYQITMAYAHWTTGRHNDPAVFELFFRKNPFGGEYTIFAGLDECLKHLAHFEFTDSDVAYLKTVPALQHCDPAFFDWLLQLDTSQVKIRSMRDGQVAFPRVPLIVVEAPLVIGQLLETTLLTLVNYPSLIATNAARMVRAARDKGPPKISGDNLPPQCSRIPACIEFGLRRAQGPDGGFSASKYSAVGGFDGTSNVQAGKLLGLNISGTHAHAFVMAYSSLDQIQSLTVKDKMTGENVELLTKVLQYRETLNEENPAYGTTNDGELAAFIAYAAAFPRSFLCLIDTYDTLMSGLLNFILVALVLDDCGYNSIGIRLDSGDLAYLSMECARAFSDVARIHDRKSFLTLDVVASNDINERVLHALNEQKHAITVYGIGTNLVTCQAQPALGCVYKLVEISGKPRLKLSQEIAKVLIPGMKKPFRLFGKDGCPLLDVMVGRDEDDPVAGERILCRHPFVARKRAAVTPSRVEALHTLVFDHGKVVPDTNRSLVQAKTAVAEQLETFRPDILRYINPTPYKVSISPNLFTFLHELWQRETPIPEFS
jgi:nicotinate phosphoribosyltransferase